MSAPSRPVRPFAAGALAGVGAVGLLVVGASAAPSPAAPTRYMVSVPVPDAVRPAGRPASRASLAGRTPRRKPLAATFTGERFDADDEPYVARAMTTGDFQEWEGADGLSRFLTAGPARLAGGRHCRDLALLVRLAEGGSRVRSAERCTTGPVSDAAAAYVDGDAELGGADQ